MGMLRKRRSDHVAEQVEFPTKTHFSKKIRVQAFSDVDLLSMVAARGSESAERYNHARVAEDTRYQWMFLLGGARAGQKRRFGFRSEKLGSFGKAVQKRHPKTQKVGAVGPIGHNLADGPQTQHIQQTSFTTSTERLAFRIGMAAADTRREPSSSEPGQKEGRIGGWWDFRRVHKA